MAEIDVKGWGPRPGAAQARVQRAFERIVDEALGTIGLRLEELPINKQGDGLLLPIPADVAKGLVTTTFVDALADRIDDHNDSCDDGDRIRARLALHAGDGVDGGGHWSGEAVVHVCRLVNAGGLRRALDAAADHPLAVIVSTYWYDTVIRQGYAPANGYRQIGVRDEAKGFAANAWVRVPGLTNPPGLTPDDDAHPPASPPGRPTDDDDGDERGGARITVHGSSFGGDLVGRDKHEYYDRPPPGHRPDGQVVAP